MAKQSAYAWDTALALALACHEHTNLHAILVTAAESSEGLATGMEEVEEGDWEDKAKEGSEVLGAS